MADASVLENIQRLIHIFNIVWKGGQADEAESAPVAWKDEETQAANSIRPIPANLVIAVGSITEEYRYIARERCPCGGAFVAKLQSTSSSASGQFDDINAACVECGNVYRFRFFLGSANARPKLRHA